jgi:hypothetical protein
MRTSAATLFVVALLCVSCSDGVSAPGPWDAGDANLSTKELPPQTLEAMWREHPLWRSGTRLRANIEDGGEGAARFDEGFTDTQLGMSCSLGIAADGASRCLPARRGTPHYLDATCKQAALVYANPGAATCPTSPLVIGGDASQTGCSASPSSPYLVAGPVPKQVVYRNESGKCVADAAYDCIYALKAAPASMFLRGTVRVEVIDDALSLRWTDYEDGASVAGSIIDRKRESTCSPSNDDRCEPDAYGYLELRKSRRDAKFAYFADASCKRPAAVSILGACGKPPSVYSLEDNVCSDLVSYHGIGAELSVGYEWIDGRCEPVPTGRTFRLFELGEKHGRATFPALLRARVGSGRLQLDYFASPDGRPLASGELYDSQFALNCFRVTFADGTTRCMPRRSSEKYARVFYTEPTCASGDEIVGMTARDCGVQPFAVAITRSSRVERVRWIGAGIDAPEQLFELLDECVPARLDPSTDPLTFRWLGDEIELAQIDQRLE